MKSKSHLFQSSVRFIFLIALFLPQLANAIVMPSKETDMDRVVLNGNDITNDGKRLLKQVAFYKEENGCKIPRTNTIYVIQDAFELAEDITIPANCILEFNGGSLRNGKINTNGCYIDAALYQVFDNIEFNSISINDRSLQVVDNIYVKVLKANAFINKKTNSIVNVNSVVNRRYLYKTTGYSTTTQNEGNTVIVTINGQKYTIASITTDKKYKLDFDCTRIIGISNSTGEMVSGEISSLKSITFYSISPLLYNKNSTVKNKEIHPEWFGAKGDNVNDDSYAFNTALDLAYYSDSKVVMGNGVYRIDDALVVHTHTNLVGVVPPAEIPVKGCFSVNTDVGVLIFDKYNPSGSYILENFGFIPYSSINKSNYIGIRIYHSQNHARISNIGFLTPKIGIEVDAIGGVQLLRCEDISMRGEENKGAVALETSYRLVGWFNANYYRPAYISHSTVIKSRGGVNNTLDGGSCEMNSYEEYLIDLEDNATLIVRGGLYKETGWIAKLRNSSRLIIEGDNYFIGNFDCDETSLAIYQSQNVQTRQNVINNTVVDNDVVLVHYKVFPKKTTLWYETVNKRVVKPLEVASNYKAAYYNERLFTSGTCKLPMGDIDIQGKTIVLRVISTTSFSSSQRSYPFALNAGVNGKAMDFSQGRSVSQKNSSVLYAPGEVNLGYVEKGERYVFIPSKQEKYILKNFTCAGNPSFLISDIYIIDKDTKEIVGNEELRIIDVMNSLDANVQYDGFLLGYNKGSSKERPTDLTTIDEGFEYFDTTLHKPIYWTGDVSIGDKGWVDAMGNYPKQ